MFLVGFFCFCAYGYHRDLHFSLHDALPILIEARFGSPTRNVAAAIIGKKFLKTGNDRARLRIARRDGTAHARIAALELHFANAKRYEFVWLRSEQLIFPEVRDAVDLERSAETQPHVAGGQSGKHAG